MSQSTPPAQPPAPPSPKALLSEFAKSHALPDLTKWIEIDAETITPAAVRAAFHEKLSYFADMLESVLYPEGISSMAEAGLYSEADHERALVVWRMIMLFGKDCALAELETTPDADIALIKQLVAAWPKLIEEMRWLITKSKDAYKGSTAAGAHISYLG